MVVRRGPHLETEVVLTQLPQGGDGEEVLSLELGVDLSEVRRRHGLQKPGHRLVHTPRLRGHDVVDQVCGSELGPARQGQSHRPRPVPRQRGRLTCDGSTSEQRGNRLSTVELAACRPRWRAGRCSGMTGGVVPTWLGHLNNWPRSSNKRGPSTAPFECWTPRLYTGQPVIRAIMLQCV